MFRRFFVAGSAALVAMVVVAAPAFAHVSIQPGDASQGGFSTQFFQVPNERDDASTTQVEVTFPTDHPIEHVSVAPVPGWTIDVEMGPIDPPIETEDGEVTEAVAKITWSGGEIQPGQFERFPVSMGALPDVDQLVFPALQTYSSGEVVRWVDAPTSDGSEPENPAPTLTLTPGGDDGHSAATDEGEDASDEAASLPENVATTDDVDSAKTLGIIGIVLGALGLGLGTVALVRKR
jgi:uncharacterized protein YcnI